MKRSLTPDEIEYYQSQGYNMQNYKGEALDFPDESSVSGSVGRSALVSALPTAAGGAAFAGTMIALAPETLGASLLAIPAAAAVGYGGSKLASKIQEPLMTEEFKKQLAVDAQMHPYATAGGALATMPLGGFNPSPANVAKAGGALGRLALGLGTNTAERQALVNVGSGAALGGIQEAVLAPMEGRDITAKDVALAAASGGVFSKPNVLGRNVYGFHDGTSRVVETPAALAKQLAPANAQQQRAPIAQVQPNLTMEEYINKALVPAMNKDNTPRLSKSAETSGKNITDLLEKNVEPVSRESIQPDIDKRVKAILEKEQKAQKPATTEAPKDPTIPSTELKTEVAGALKAKNLSAALTPEYADTVISEILNERGIQVAPDGSLPINGKAFFDEGTRKVLFNPDKAAVDTLPHEGLHHMRWDLETAAEKGDARAKSLLEAWDKLSAPELEKINAERVTAKLEPQDAHEFAVSQQGFEFVKQQLNLKRETPWKRWWNDTKALFNQKYNTGKVSLEDMRRAVNFKFVHERQKLQTQVGNKQEREQPFEPNEVPEDPSTWSKETSNIVEDALTSFLKSMNAHEKFGTKIPGLSKEAQARIDAKRASKLERNQGGQESLIYSPDDLAEYNRLKAEQLRLISEGKVMDKEGKMTPEFHQVWTDFEKVRNRNNGMPPKQYEGRTQPENEGLSDYNEMMNRLAADASYYYSRLAEPELIDKSLYTKYGMAVPVGNIRKGGSLDVPVGDEALDILNQLKLYPDRFPNPKMMPAKGKLTSIRWGEMVNLPHSSPVDNPELERRFGEVLGYSKAAIDHYLGRNQPENEGLPSNDFTPKPARIRIRNEEEKAKMRADRAKYAEQQKSEYDKIVKPEERRSAGVKPYTYPQDKEWTALFDTRENTPPRRIPLSDVVNLDTRAGMADFNEYVRRAVYTAANRIRAEKKGADLPPSYNPQSKTYGIGRQDYDEIAATVAADVKANGVDRDNYQGAGAMTLKRTLYRRARDAWKEAIRIKSQEKGQRSLDMDVGEEGKTSVMDVTPDTTETQTRATVVPEVKKGMTPQEAAAAKVKALEEERATAVEEYGENSDAVGEIDDEIEMWSKRAGRAQGEGEGLSDQEEKLLNWASKYEVATVGKIGDVPVVRLGKEVFIKKGNNWYSKVLASRRPNGSQHTVQSALEEGKANIVDYNEDLVEYLNTVSKFPTEQKMLMGPREQPEGEGLPSEQEKQAKSLNPEWRQDQKEEQDSLYRPTPTSASKRKFDEMRAAASREQPEGEGLAKRRNTLIRQYNDTVKEIKAADQRPLGLRKVVAAEQSYKAGWSNGSEQWDVSRIGSYERTAIDKNVDWNNPTAMREWREKHAKLLDKPFASKGEEIELDSNQILIPARSKAHAELIAKHLPEPPFAVNAAERNPLLHERDFEKALQQFMELEPNKIDTVKETSHFMDKLDTERYQEENEGLFSGKHSFFSAMAPTFDKVKTINPELGDAFDKWEIAKRGYIGMRNEALASLQKFNPEDVRRVAELRREAFRADNSEPLDLKGEDAEINDALKKYYFDDIGMARQNLGLLIEKRAAGTNENYQPDMLNEQTLDLFTSRPNSPEALYAVNNWAEYVAEHSDGEISFSEAKKHINDYIDAIGGPNDHYKSVNFGAIRKAQGYGLPDELRELDPLKTLSRYGSRAASDLAMFQELESKPAIAAALKIPNPNTGKIPDHPNAEMRYSAQKEVRNAMKWVMNDFGNTLSKSQPHVNAFVRLVHNSLLGGATGLRDLASVPVNMMPYIHSFSDLSTALKGMINFREHAADALRSGAKQPNLDLVQFNTILDSPSRGLALMHKAATAMRKWQGREALENFSRDITFAAGKELALAHIEGAKSGNKNSEKFIEKFGTGAEGKTGEEAANIMAANFTERNQGTYGGRGLPVGIVESQFAPFFSLQKWGVEKANVIFQDVFKPALTGENYVPLLTYSLGTILTGAAIQEMNKVLMGRKPQDPDIKEAIAKGDAKAYAQELATLMQLGNFSGIVGDVMKAAVDAGVRGKTARNVVSFPTYTAVSDTGEKLTDMAEAIRQGENPWEVIKMFSIDMLSQNIQNVRALANRTVKEKDLERSDKFRDRRIYNELEGKPAGEIPKINKYLGIEERKFKQASTPAEIRELLPQVLAKAKRQAEGNPEKMRQAIVSLKGNSYQTMPSPTDSPYEFRAYYEYLVKTQGKVEADKRVKDYLTQRMLNQQKSRLLPTVRR